MYTKKYRVSRHSLVTTGHRNHLRIDNGIMKNPGTAQVIPWPQHNACKIHNKLFRCLCYVGKGRTNNIHAKIMTVIKR